MRAIAIDREDKNGDGEAREGRPGEAMEECAVAGGAESITGVIDKAVVVGERALTQRSNCQTLVERIRRLKPLLDEVRESKLCDVSGGVWTLESLERAIEKAKELLEKCGGSGSRVYMDIHRQEIVSKFQAVTLDIDRSLNSLPLVSLRVSDHIRSQVESLTRELRRAKYNVDPMEECVGEDIEALLREQRQGLKSSGEALQKLADRLQLRSMESFAQEIQALEKERDKTQVEKNKSEEELITEALDLVDKMKICFRDQEPAVLEIPSDFRCPLSQELMSDPVIVASGQTYEKVYIQHWIAQGHTRCPKTLQRLSHKNLIPNYTVKALINNWCEKNNVPLPGPVKLNPHLSTLHPVSPDLPTKASSESEQLTSQDSFRKQGSTVASTRGAIWPRWQKLGSSRGLRELERVRNGSLGGDEGEASQTSQSPSRCVSGELEGHNSPLRSESDPAVEHDIQHARTASDSSVASSVNDRFVPPKVPAGVTIDAAQAANERYPDTVDISRATERMSLTSVSSGLFNEEPGSPARLPEKSIFRRRGEERDVSLPRIVPDTSGADSSAQQDVDRWVEDLQSPDVDVQRQAAAELRLLAKHNMENRITIANSGAIRPLVALLSSTDAKTQENAVTALLNLSINDNNKAEIAHAGAIEPLVNVLRVGNSEAMENSAATLFSLSVMDDNKVSIGASGAIPPLVHLLINGTPRGKKDAATALFNLSIFHENKGRIVRAGAIRPLVELMAEPAAGMVDKAVAVLANLATIPEGRHAVGEEHGIPALVEVVEAGSQRGKENAAAALLQLCTNSHRHRALVLQEGAIPPLVALSQSGTPRAKEKATALLRHFREQRHGGLGGRSNPDRHMAGHY